jgi:hypothetical protein
MDFSFELTGDKASAAALVGLAESAIRRLTAGIVTKCNVTVKTAQLRNHCVAMVDAATVDAVLASCGVSASGEGREELQTFVESRLKTEVELALMQVLDAYSVQLGFQAVFPN